MKVAQEKSNLTRSKVVNRTACGIHLNAHSFKILSRLYSDPILAILRELGTNAAESHARADCLDTQFVVKLPNKLDPNFSVRDFGVGMDVDTVHNVYANYMASDKRDTNTEGGYFGLGSKTPFCYTDSFNVICYQGGTCRRYVMALNEDGCPELNEFPATDTEEPDGVEISFTVKEKDFDRFYRKAEEAYRFFRFRPRITGTQDIQIKELDYLVQDPNKKFNGIISGYESYVIMGDIGYPLDNDHFSGKIQQLIRSGAVVEVGMGGLDLVPSREGLEYTDHTKTTIIQRCEELLEVLNDLVEQQFEACTSFWQASLLYQKLNTKFGSLSQFIKSLSEKTFSEQVLCERLTLSFHVKKLQVKYSYHHGYTVKRPVETRVITIKDETQLYLADISGAYSRISNKIRNNDVDREANYYIIEEEDLPAFLEKSGLKEEDIIKVSSLPKPKRFRDSTGNNGPRRPRTYQNVLEFDYNERQPGNRLPRSSFWCNATHVEIHKDEYVYCKFFRNEIVSDRVNVRQLQRIFMNLKKLGINLPKVYGVRKTEKVSSLPNWKPLSVYLGEVYVQLIAQFNSSDFKEINKHSDLLDILEKVMRAKRIDLTHDNHIISRLLASLQIDRQGVTYLLDKLAPYDTMKDTRKLRPASGITTLIKMIKRRYPFLEHVGRYNVCTTVANDIIQTINLIDGQST